MKVMVFDASSEGHHMEYMHHIKTVLDKSAVEYVFVAPESFKQKTTMLNWVWMSKGKLDMIDAGKMRSAEQSSPFIKKIKTALIAKSYVKKHQPDQLFLLDYPSVMPFLPLFTPPKLKISGIVYRIFFYEWRTLSLITKTKDILESWMLAKSNKIRNVFILNDPSAVAYYRHRFHSNKFRYLPDPVMETGYQPQNIREELGIKKDQRFFLQMGGLGIRKGTMTILEAIALSSENVCSNSVFVFAGLISGEIRDSFMKKVSQLSSKCKIIVEEGFLPYERLMDLCYSSDVVLLPYLNISQSSGVFGQAARWGKAVIGPAEGTLGKMIRRYPAGLAIRKLDAQKLSEAMLDNEIIPHQDMSYLSTHSVGSFQRVIANLINQNE